MAKHLYQFSCSLKHDDSTYNYLVTADEEITPDVTFEATAINSFLKDFELEKKDIDFYTYADLGVIGNDVKVKGIDIEDLV